MILFKINYFTPSCKMGVAGFVCLIWTSSTHACTQRSSKQVVNSSKVEMYMNKKLETSNINKNVF